MATPSDVSAPERPSRLPGDTPRTIRVHPDDNVAIVVNAFGLPAGTTLPEGITLREFVPQGHKVALTDIAKGGAVRRYGEIVGLAIDAIPEGSWVEESRVETPAAPDLDTLDMTIRPPAPLPPLDGYTFEGFRNPDGTVGTKNILAISTSVQCVAGTLDVAIRKIKEELLPRFPNVDDVVGLTHTYGCGVAISAPEAHIPIRTLQNIARNPNFGGEVMVVGLGCEKLVSERLLPDATQTGAVTRLQDEHHAGFGMMIDTIMTMAEQRLDVLNRPAPRDLPRVRPRGRPAMRRQRRLLRRDRQPRHGHLRRSARALRRDGAVLRGDGGARRDPPPHPPRGDARGGAGAGARDGVVRRLPRQGRRRPPGEPLPRQQEGRAQQHRGEGAGLRREIRREPDQRGSGAR